MTGHPTAENHEHWWLYLANSATSDTLHAVPHRGWDYDQWAEEDDCRLPAVAECGLKFQATYPGLGARLDASRCRKCCRLLNVPHGFGAPANAEYRKKLLGEGK